MSFWDANGPLGVEPFMPASMEENVIIARLGCMGNTGRRSGCLVVR